MSYVNVQGRRIPFVIRYVSEVFAFRHLCGSLVGSDLRSRFRRSRLGILWAIIQPLAFSLMVAVVWGAMFKIENYWDFALYIFSGMLVWEYFSTTFLVSQDSLMGAEGYLRQTSIPLIIFQVRTPISGLLIFCFGLVGLLILLAVLQRLPPPGLHLLLVPAFLALFLMFAIPLSILMSILGAQFRDLKHISILVVQALFFISPVMLDRALLDKPEFIFLEFLNPMVAFLDMFRAPLLSGIFWTQQELYSALGWIGALWLLALFVTAKVGRRIVFAL